MIHCIYANIYMICQIMFGCNFMCLCRVKIFLLHMLLYMLLRDTLYNPIHDLSFCPFWMCFGLADTADPYILRFLLMELYFSDKGLSYTRWIHSRRGAPRNQQEGVHYFFPHLLVTSVKEEFSLETEFPG